MLALLAVLHGTAFASALASCPRDTGVLPLSGAIRGIRAPAIARDTGAAFFPLSTGPGIRQRWSYDLRHSAAAVFPAGVHARAPEVVPGALECTRDGWAAVADGPQGASFTECPPLLVRSGR